MKTPKYDARYYAPEGKKPIAYSTGAVQEELYYLAREYETIGDIHELFKNNAMTRDLEAVTSAYMRRGLGHLKAIDYFFVPAYKWRGGVMFKEMHRWAE